MQPTGVGGEKKGPPDFQPLFSPAGMPAAGGANHAERPLFPKSQGPGGPRRTDLWKADRGPQGRTGRPPRGLHSPRRHMGAGRNSAHPRWDGRRLKCSLAAPSPWQKPRERHLSRLRGAPVPAPAAPALRPFLEQKARLHLRAPRAGDVTHLPAPPGRAAPSLPPPPCWARPGPGGQATAGKQRSPGRAGPGAGLGSRRGKQQQQLRWAFARRSPGSCLQTSPLAVVV